MNGEREQRQRASFGGGRSRVTVKCPSCGNEVALLDREFARYGPVRCGACGTDLRNAAIRSSMLNPFQDEGGH